jgi:spore coat protein U domain-containing protein, fimbrial subunit CupE1/2/3/6
MHIKKMTAFAAVAAMAAIVSSTPATAGTATASFTVSADVVATCIIGATALDFTNYDSAAGNKDVQSTVSVTCSNGSTYNIGLDKGASAGATVTARAMTGPGSALLSYALYRDSGRTLNWGQTVGTDTKSGTGSGANQNVTVYGRVPGSQYVGVGHYSDTITATVTF